MTSFISDQDEDPKSGNKAVFGVIALTIFAIWIAAAMWHSAKTSGEQQAAPASTAVLECTRLNSYELTDETISLWDCGESKRAYLRERDADKYTALRLVLPQEESINAAHPPVPRD